MQLLERYLNAVRIWLPRDQRQDIIAELTEDIQSEIDEQQAHLGRPLTGAELEALLKQRGSPLAVAGRFGPQQYLIGPQLFPVYWLVLRVVSTYYLGPWLIVAICFVTLNAVLRGTQPGPAIVSSMQTFWMLVLYLFGGLTAVFAILEHTPAKTSVLDALQQWNPRRLPPARDPNAIPRSTSVSDAISNVVFVLWWTGAFRLPQILGMHLTLTPFLGNQLFWPILLWASASAAFGCVAAVHARWTRSLSWIHLAISATGIALVALVIAAGQAVVIDIPGVGPKGIADATRWANYCVLGTFFFIGVFHVWHGMQDVLRLLGRKPVHHPAACMFAGE